MKIVKNLFHQSCLGLLVISIGVPSLAASSKDIVCKGYEHFRSETSLSEINPAAETLNGVQLPATSNTIFRGAYESNPQFSLETVTAAILNPASAQSTYVSSPMFFGIVQVLSGKKALTDTFIPSGGLPLQMHEYLRERKILDEVKTLMECKAPEFYSETEASPLAAELLNKYFSSSARYQLEKNYFNIESPDYYAASTQNIGLGNNAVDFVIGSVYDQIAAIYGYKILILKDSKKRGVDLGFFNLKKNGRYAHQWVDNGEINIPGYITSEEVLGYQQRQNDRIRGDRSWSAGHHPNPIQYAVYRHRFKDKTIGLVVSGDNSICLTEGSDHRYYKCADYWSGVITTPTPLRYPKVASERVEDRAPLLGIVVNCAGEKDCPSIKEVSQWYGKNSDQELSPSVVERLQKITAGTTAVTYAPASLQKSLPKPQKSSSWTGIKVLKASYQTNTELQNNTNDNNATDKAGRFANGKSSVTFKVSARHLLGQNDRTPRQFKMEWACGDEPDTKFTKLIPAPAESNEFDLSCK